MAPGAIVNASSGAGLTGYPGQSGYVAAKHGVIGLTRTVALEYSAQGIRMNAICPGTTRTPMVAGALDHFPKIADQLVGLHPIGRIAEASEIAEAAVWLCTDAASFVLGTALSVDGGYTALCVANAGAVRSAVVMSTRLAMNASSSSGGSPGLVVDDARRVPPPAA